MCWPATASRLPQSRRLRQQPIFSFLQKLQPPQDCRSRGDCGPRAVLGFAASTFRLKIAAVAATAASV